MRKCLVSNSSELLYKKLQKIDLWAVYIMLTSKQRFESEKKYKTLRR